MLNHLHGFQILRRIGQSNTAEIFHVVRTVGENRGSEYAAKVLREACAHDRTERKHLETEYDVCSGLDHPNLVRAYEVRLDARRPFLVMDLVRHSRSLRQHLETGPPPLGAALDWLAKVADGLAYLHETGYVHLDVKPQNLLVGNGGADVKVIDFALADQRDGWFGRHLLRRLLERRRPGTWSYMAPERIRNRRLTTAADIYGLGVTLYEAVTGRLPFTAPSPQALMEQHLYAPIPSLSQAGVDVPPAVDDLVRAMLAKDPLDRPAGMLYVSAKLHAAAGACRGASDGHPGPESG